MESEVSALLVITVIVGTALMTSLLVCYICVFRQLCCSDEQEMHRRNSQRCSKRSCALARRDSLNMGELTHVSSQQTETEKM